MMWALLGIPIGIVFLYFSSDWLVDGAKNLALRWGMSPFIVGLTVVAIGTSCPEAITSLVSGDNPELIIGNIVGSNTANIGICIGIGALLCPVLCKFTDNLLEIVCMVASVVIVTLMALTGTIGSVFGIILLALMFVYLILICKFRVNAGEDKEECEMSMFKCIALVLLGIVVLYVGAKLFIIGSEELAGLLGLSDLLIGLILVAIGTSLPELCVTLMAANKARKGDISANTEVQLIISNIIGSITFNCFFALGVGALVANIPIAFYTMRYHIPVMLLFCAMMLLMVKVNNGIRKKGGALLLGAYAVYVALMVVFPELAQGVM